MWLTLPVRQTGKCFEGCPGGHYAGAGQDVLQPVKIVGDRRYCGRFKREREWTTSAARWGSARRRTISGNGSIVGWE